MRPKEFCDEQVWNTINKRETQQLGPHPRMLCLCSPLWRSGGPVGSTLTRRSSLSRLGWVILKSSRLGWVIFKSQDLDEVWHPFLVFWIRKDSGNLRKALDWKGPRPALAGNTPRLGVKRQIGSSGNLWEFVCFIATQKSVWSNLIGHAT